jgi:hypothetical protein
MSGALVPLSARSLSFPEQNFRCEIPDTWTMIRASGSQVVAKSPTGRESFALMTGMLSEGLTIDSSQFLQKTRLIFTKEGFDAEGPSYVMLQGQRFSFWRLEPPDPNVFGKQPACAWIMIADGRVYSMKLSSDEDPNSNSDLMAMLNSFQFIAPPRIPIAGEGESDLQSSPVGNHETATPFSPGFLIFMIFGLALGPAMGMVILVVFIRRHLGLANARPPKS